MGIEPTLSAWKAEVLPLNYTRAHHQLALSARQHRTLSPSLPRTPGPADAGWWRGEDSNLRRQSRQIYSLIPLAAREPLQNVSRALCWRKPRVVNG